MINAEPGGSVGFRTSGSEHVVTFVGDVSLDVADAIGQSDIESCRTTGQLTVDMTRCTLIDSLGIAVLLRMRAVAEQGVVLIGPSDGILKLLSVTGLDAAFSVQPA